ncbi:hypothetical protein JIG36_04340 [Actinoplanes sp. LDG1-06]|uniref:Tetratricopeptide repeat protein n=1 Tax=Paractinoplanes ovalisporus TaxID=2810368 RepID=A0ABS2A4M2_9ACTN|nr:hypothetical protein [Actinoplanes ovalisporus]MBM2614784.1 hypothetical protein [Actinoplanes ovalisporus]
MPPAESPIRARYTRHDPRGAFPRRAGGAGIEANRLAMYWRPIIDLGSCPFPAIRMRLIRGLDDGLWFSRLGVPGLRRQVLRHAGLDDYDCPDPTALAEEKQSPRWRSLVAGIRRFDELGDDRRAALVLHLAQLSFSDYAVALAGAVEPTGEPERDAYAYHVARVRSRLPGRMAATVPLFERLAATAATPRLVVQGCFQVIGNTVVSGGDLALARRHEQRARAAMRPAGGWHDHLVLSRLHRAFAMLRGAEGDHEGRRAELREARAHNDRLMAEPLDELVALEDRAHLADIAITGGLTDPAVTPARMRELAHELATLDPYCVQSRLVVGDAYAALHDYGEAARWYAAAGELGTGDGAVGWYRAGQCHALAGRPREAAEAMGRCLDLDTTAVEPREYLLKEELT